MNRIKQFSIVIAVMSILTTFVGCVPNLNINNDNQSDANNSKSEELKEREYEIALEIWEAQKNPDTEYWEGVDYSDESYFSVEDNENGVTITEFEGGADEIKIPLTIGGKSVTTIGSKAFANSNVKSVYIPESVTMIDWGAFDTCSHLSRIYISEGVTEIGHHAFHKCDSLTYVFFPDSMNSIGDAAFSLCYSLESASISKNCFTGIATFDTLHKSNGFNLQHRLTELEIVLVAQQMAQEEMAQNE